MAGDRIGRALPWLLGATIVLFGAIVALVFIGRAYAPGHIHEAAAQGNVVMVRWLVLVRPDVLDALDSHGGTPLHAAAENGYGNVAKLLLSAGADVNAKHGEGYKPLDLAETRRSDDVAEMLREHGAGGGQGQ